MPRNYIRADPPRAKLPVRKDDSYLKYAYKAYHNDRVEYVRGHDNALLLLDLDQNGIFRRAKRDFKVKLESHDHHPNKRIVPKIKARWLSK